MRTITIHLYNGMRLSVRYKDRNIVMALTMFQEGIARVIEAHYPYTDEKNKMRTVTMAWRKEL